MFPSVGVVLFFQFSLSCNLYFVQSVPNILCKYKTREERRHKPQNRRDRMTQAKCPNEAQETTTSLEKADYWSQCVVPVTYDHKVASWTVNTLSFSNIIRTVHHLINIWSYILVHVKEAKPDFFINAKPWIWWFSRDSGVFLGRENMVYGQDAKVGVWWAKKVVLCESIHEFDINFLDQWKSGTS